LASLKGFEKAGQVIVSQAVNNVLVHISGDGQKIRQKQKVTLTSHAGHTDSPIPLLPSGPGGVFG